MTKKQSLLCCMAVIAAGSLFAAMKFEENPMKLVNIRTGFVVVEFKDGSPLFHDRFLEAEMKERGVVIPKDKKSDFNGQDTVFPGDPLFLRAFAEIYVPLAIASSLYQWQQ